MYNQTNNCQCDLEATIKGGLCTADCWKRYDPMFKSQKHSDRMDIDSPTALLGTSSSSNQAATTAQEQQLQYLINESTYLQLKSKIDSILATTTKQSNEDNDHHCHGNRRRRVKPKVATNTASKSLFDMFPASGSLSLLSERFTIRDILDFKNTVGEKEPSLLLLENCYKAHVSDLILGFNTTESEIYELTQLLLDQLQKECIYDNCNNHINDEKREEEGRSKDQSFLKLHWKWMETCTQEGEESHSFAFLLVRNVMFALYHYQDQFEKQQGDHNNICDHDRKEEDQTINKKMMEIIQIMMKMMRKCIALVNDAKATQIAWLELLYILVLITKNDVSGGTFLVSMAVLDRSNQTPLLVSCIACVSSSVTIQRFLQRSCLPSSILYTLVRFDSILNGYDSESLKEMLKAKTKVDGGDYDDSNGKVALNNIESIVVEYALALLKDVILLLSTKTLLQLQLVNVPLKTDTIGKENDIIYLDQIHDFFAFIEKDEVFIGKDSSQSELNITLLLEPFYHILHIGLCPESSHFITTKLASICSEAITYLIIQSSHHEYIAFENIMLQQQTLLETIIENITIPTNELNVLSPSIRAIIQIYKQVLLFAPWENISQSNVSMNVWIKQWDLLLKCVDGLLSSYSTNEDSPLSVWSDVIEVLLPLVKMKVWDSFASERKPFLLSIVNRYQDIATSAMESIESIMLMHSIVYAIKGRPLVDENDKNVATNVSMLYWSSLSTIPTMTIDPVLSCTGTRIFDFDLLLRLAPNQNDGFRTHVSKEDLPMIQAWVKDVLVIHMLTKQIDLMMQA
jgi:hypothetical protein